MESIRRITRLQLLLGDRPKGNELASFLLQVAGRTIEDEISSKAALGATLMAALKLAKAGVVSLMQADPFGPIWLTGRSEAVAA